MSVLKLSKLPDRTPVKLTLTISSDLNHALQIYSEKYEQAYGVKEPLTELIPFMLQAFLESDKKRRGR